MVQCLSNINPSKITSTLDQDRGKEGLTEKGPTSNGVTLPLSPKNSRTQHFTTALKSVTFLSSLRSGKFLHKPV